MRRGLVVVTLLALGTLDVSGDGNVSGYIGVEGEAPMLGGSWRPSNCTSRHRIAVVVPYRHREQHLSVFVHHMHPFLQRQMLDYTIYVVEQVSSSSLSIIRQFITILTHRELLGCY